MYTIWELKMPIDRMSEVKRLAAQFVNLCEINEQSNTPPSMSERNVAMQKLQVAIAEVSFVPSAITYVVPGTSHQKRGQRGQIVGIAVDGINVCLLAAFPDGSYSSFALSQLGGRYELTRLVCGKWLMYTQLRGSQLP